MSDNEMTPRDFDAPQDAKISRRRFVAGASAACLAFLSEARRARGGDQSAPPPRFLKQWGKRGKGPGEFSACVGIAIDQNDVVYTGEFRNQRVQKFTTEGEFLGSFDVEPHAGGVAVDAQGNVYVAHWNSNKLGVYSPAGKRLREWGAKGTGDGQFQLPGSVALGPDGLLYVPDQGNSRVQKFTREGKFVGKFGKLGKEPGEFGGGQPAGTRFAGPQFVAFDRAGNVYTTDAALGRIQKFTPEGKLLAYWGTKSAEPGGFGPPPLDKKGKPFMGGPIGLCVDRNDNVWVGATNHRVQQFTNAGKFICGLGGLGSEPGHFRTPHALALDSHGCLYVADTMNSRIQKFAAA